MDMEPKFYSNATETLEKEPLSKIDHKKHLFPFCVVWCPIPVLSWLFPTIGHMGICTSDGVIHDFAGPYYVSHNHMGFGWPSKYFQIDPSLAGGKSEWDKAIYEANDIYAGRMHNLFCDNCHSHVARAFNLMRLNNKSQYTMIHLWFMMITRGKFVGLNGLIRSWLPTLIIWIVVIAIIISLRSTTI